ncbi:chemoreceptor glutamine deamidase CheD [Noviherbaspirillum agri]
MSKHEWTMMRHRIGIYLQPGEYFVGHAGHSIRTLLGSCVSITLWHPARRIGAMSHFLLPSRGTPPAATPDGRYGDEAMRLMLDELARLDVDGRECHAKVFGGARMFPVQPFAGAMHVGRRNGVAARRLLQEHGIAIVLESLFGDGHRQIVFDVDSGDVWARHARLPSPKLPELPEFQERA